MFAPGKMIRTAFSNSSLRFPALRKIRSDGTSPKELSSENEDLQKCIERLTHELSPQLRVDLLKGALERAREEAYPPNPYNWPPFDYYWFKYAAVNRSLIFYADLFPIICEWLLKQPRGSTFRLLDVGGSTGVGGEFLGRIFWDHFTGYKLSVEVIDILDTFRRLTT